MSLPPDIARYTSPIIQLPAHNSSSPNISSIQQPLAPLEPDSTVSFIIEDSTLLLCLTHASQLSERPAFLPLPPTFNYAATNEWADVAQKIQDWLVLSDAEDTAHLRAWGTELFWVAFVAANPTFPRGAWPKWDERVPLEGAFIAKWMVGGVAACFGPVEGDLPSADYLHLSLWRLFSSIVSRQFPDSPPILNVPF